MDSSGEQISAWSASQHIYLVKEDTRFCAFLLLLLNPIGRGCSESILSLAVLLIYKILWLSSSCARSIKLPVRESWIQLHWEELVRNENSAWHCSSLHNMNYCCLCGNPAKRLSMDFWAHGVLVLTATIPLIICHFEMGFFPINLISFFHTVPHVPSVSGKMLRSLWTDDSLLLHTNHREFVGCIVLFCILFSLEFLYPELLLSSMREMI